MSSTATYKDIRLLREKGLSWMRYQGKKYQPTIDRLKNSGLLPPTIEKNILNIQKMLNCKNFKELSKILGVGESTFYKIQNKSPFDVKVKKYLLIEKILIRLSKYQ